MDIANRGLSPHRSPLRRLGLLAAAGLLLGDAAAREGLRLLGRPVPPSSLWLAGALLALAAAAAWPRVRSLALAAFVGLVATGALALARDAERWEPLRLRVQFRALETPGAEWRVAQASLDQLASPAALLDVLGRRQALELAVSGTLNLPEGGLQRFTVACDGACQMRVDGQHRPSDADVDLAAGSHSFEVELVAPQWAFVRLGWHRPVRLAALELRDIVGSTPIPPQALEQRERTRLLRVPLAATAHGLLLFGLIGLSQAAWQRRSALVTQLRRLDRPDTRDSALVFTAAVLFLAALRIWAAPHALAGGYFQGWTSEFMMQTVSAADLRTEPLRSLVFLHIQPPGFDALRALLVARHADLGGTALLQAIDQDLYRVFGLLYGLCVALAFVWLRPAHGRGKALLGATLVACHPAVIYYATFLDSTFASALLLTWFVLELQRLGPGGQGSVARTATALIVLFLTRSIVQWPFLLVLAASAWLCGLERRRTLRLLAAVGLVMGLFVAKQYALFGLTLSSSFGPDSFCKGLSDYCQGTTPVDLPRALPAPGAAGALRRTVKLNGEYNYNQLAFLRRSFSQLVEYRALLRSTPLPTLAGLMAHNVELWLLPSSRHSPHTLVAALRWRGAYDYVSSGWRLVALVALASGLWVVRVKPDRALWWRALGLALPVAYFTAVSIVFESGENMRYKFFVEPVLVLFVLGELLALARRVRR